MDDTRVQHLHAVEYVALDGEPGGGSIEIRAGNAWIGGGPNGRHRRGTPTDEEWRTETLVGALDPVWGDLMLVVCLLGGWNPDIAIMGRIGATGTPSRNGVSLRRAIETGKTIEHPEWNSFSALLHVREWQLARDADTGYFDLYFVANADAVSNSTLEDDPAVTERLASMESDIGAAIRRVMQTLVSDIELVRRLAAVGIATPPVSWEEATMPVYGGGAYHFRFVAL